FQRNPAVDTSGTLVDRSEQIGSARQVLHRQLEKQSFTGKARTHEPANLGIVRFAMSDGVIEDRRIGRQARDRKTIDVAFKRAAIEKLARDVVEPDALPQVLERLSSFHLTSRDRGRAHFTRAA